MITKNITASTTIVLPETKNTDCSTTPSATAATNVTGKLSIRPMTAAARARSNRLGPSTEPMATPWMGSRRSTPSPDIPAAITHTRVPSRFTGTPSSDARSADSACARTAMPMSVYRKNATRPSVTIGTTMRISRWPALNVTGNHVHRK